MTKKDTKTKAAEKKARIAAKHSKKADKKEKKSKGRKGDDSDAEDVDLEAVLEEYAKQQAQLLKVTELPSEPPSPRSSATLIGSPTDASELFLFGGEYFDGALATIFNDLFIYLIDKGEWRKVTSPNSPLPRSGHAWCQGKNSIYLFGGEFSSPKQGTFYHYNDFWTLLPESREWQKIEAKGKSPPARSGHRMTCYKNYIILFGGFQDTSQQTKYLQDLWLYDTQNYVWHNPTMPPAAQKPDARSSFSFLPHDSGAVIFGGYSRVKANAVSGKQTKGGGQIVRSVLKPIIHQDTWFLRITQPPAGSSGSTPPTIRWERRKRPANAPNPPRAGATMAYHKSRGIAFGGVHDVEASEEGIDSEFFNVLFAWNIDRNRFFPLTLRRPRGPQKSKQPQAERGKRGRGKADEEELLRNLAALEASGSIKDSEAMNIDIPEAEDEQPTPEQPVVYEMPHARFNAQLAVQGDVLYIFGGTFEQGDQEFTFDEMHAIDLGKLDGVKQIFHRELENWTASDMEESDSEQDEDEEDSGDEEMGDGDISMTDSKSVTTEATATTEASEETLVEEEQEQKADDFRPYPRPFENLRDFYARTSTVWQELVIQYADSQSLAAGSSVKELKKKAFDMAESKWWDCREDIMALEDQQEEAGIGEVVSLADRGEGAAAGLRRR